MDSFIYRVYNLQKSIYVSSLLVIGLVSQASLAPRLTTSRAYRWTLGVWTYILSSRFILFGHIMASSQIGRSLSLCFGDVGCPTSCLGSGIFPRICYWSRHCDRGILLLYRKIEDENTLKEEMGVIIWGRVRNRSIVRRCGNWCTDPDKKSLHHGSTQSMSIKWAIRPC